MYLSIGATEKKERARLENVYMAIVQSENPNNVTNQKLFCACDIPFELNFV